MLTVLLGGLLLAACGRVGIELRPLDGDPLTQADGSTGPGGTPDAGPGSCQLDSDDDGTVDCQDECRDDPEKTLAGVCGCAVSEADRDGDGRLDCVDSCGGSNDASYLPDATCGVGYCQTNNTPSSCVAGSETLCRAGSPLSANDVSCDGVDDNCSGTVDEDYVASANCGVGSCRTRATPSSCSGGVVTACQPAAPLASNDATKDGVDDDCDGVIDEDACIAHTETFGVGSHSSSPGTCTTVTVRLWGAGGASGDAQGGYWGSTVGGTGGAGGFAQGVFTVNAGSTVRLFVGQGGQGCGGAGSNADTTHNGGAGATTRSSDGTVGAGSAAGGTGASPSGGGKGGNAFFGGGGGGAGSGPGYAPFGAGGGGGAGSLLIVDGMRMTAGGGGGGGGAGTNIATTGFSGGNGGPGCTGNGVSATSAGGGGGGGGVCQGGASSQRGTGRTPYDAASELSAGAAAGGNNNADCSRGGDGYAILSYTP